MPESEVSVEEGRRLVLAYRRIKNAERRAELLAAVEKAAAEDEGDEHTPNDRY